MAPRHLRRLLATLPLTAIVVAGLAAPAGAVVRFEPTPAPTLPSPRPGERVEIAWAGVAITFPEQWEVRLKRPPTRAVEGGAAVLGGTRSRRRDLHTGPL